MNARVSLRAREAVVIDGGRCRLGFRGEGMGPI